MTQNITLFSVYTSSVKKVTIFVFSVSFECMNVKKNFIQKRRFLKMSYLPTRISQEVTRNKKNKFIQFGYRAQSLNSGLFNV